MTTNRNTPGKGARLGDRMELLTGQEVEVVAVTTDHNAACGQPGGYIVFVSEYVANEPPFADKAELVRRWKQLS